MTRCVATSQTGERCLLDATHGNDGHAYPPSYAYLFGWLSSIVEGFLAGKVDREFLANQFVEIEAERTGAA